ncbi:MAG: DUF3347 domain-containing protein [Thermoanaerobaculia bacterium]|nr:DUF3347 domain-containing protein [Thermoanaerobaculia bacterium]
MFLRASTLFLGLMVAAAGLLRAAEPSDAFGPIVAEYEVIRAALAADKTDGTAERAKKLEAFARESVTAQQAGVPEAAAGELATLLPKIAAAAAKVATTEGLAAVRDAFGELSAPLVRWFELRTTKGDWAIAYCPMAEQYWLQKKTPEVDNPFYGSEMLTCGRFVAKVEE